jgi:hypothetical protein
MGNLLYTVAIILIILWLVGYLGFHLGYLIHILLVIAIISIILRLIQGRNHCCPIKVQRALDFSKPY